MLTYFFPGQGSQKKGMGGDLFEAFPEYMKIADEVLGYSMAELCLEDPDSQLNLTQFTQPALYVVNALTFLQKKQESDVTPDFFAGHSLGEYNALFAAGAFDFETGLRLVQKRGQLMGEAKGGGMAAVIGLEEDKVRDVLQDSGLTTIDVANLNSPKQIVLSGPTDDILSLKDAYKAAGVRMYAPLKVSAAFHSRYMKPASDTFREFLKGFTFKPLQVPVISNVEARPYQSERIPELLSAQIVSSVKWTESIRYLMGKGVTEFVEVGPGKVLAGLYKKIKAEAEPLVIADEPTPQAEAPTASEPAKKKITAGQNLGNEAFRKTYGLRYAYMAGGMCAGISSPQMVLKLAHAGLLGSFGTAGLSQDEVLAGIRHIQAGMPQGVSFAVNLVNDFKQDSKLQALIDLCLNEGVGVLEAANFVQITPELVKFRLRGVTRDGSGQVVAPHRIIAKTTRPEVAKAFLSPAPERLVSKLVAAGQLSQAEAALANDLPMADDLIAQADGAWHTDLSDAFSVSPAFQALRDEAMRQYGYTSQIRVGAAGGIGTPQAAAAAFVLGADFVVTGSINQATVEAGTSSGVKDMLAEAGVQDTDYAPAMDLFELGGKVQVLKRGMFYPARANKLSDLYRHAEALADVDENTRTRIQERFFKRSFDEVWTELKNDPAQAKEVAIAERNEKAKMAMIFKWYLAQGMTSALRGDSSRKVDFKIYCGPALGSFNEWVKGTALEAWSQRHVDQMAEHLMDEAATFLQNRMGQIGL